MQLKLSADCWQIANVFSLKFQETLTYCKHSGLCMIIIERVLYILAGVFFCLSLTETVMELVNVSAYLGQNPTWRCEVQSTIPLEFSWYYNDELVSNSSVSGSQTHMDDTANSSYTLPNVSYSDNGSMVRCSAAGSVLVVNSSVVYLTSKLLWHSFRPRHKITFICITEVRERDIKQ